MVSSIFHEHHLCLCLERIENKYVKIRNAAMEADRLNNPNTSFFDLDDNVLKSECAEYSADYLVEIISLQHDSKCSANNYILKLLSDSKKFHLIQSNEMSQDDFQNAIENLKVSYFNQMLENEEKIKSFTSGLHKIITTAYWGYLTSREHSKLMSELLKPIQVEVTATKNKRQPVNEIALIHIYNEIQITTDNAIIIAEQYGYTKPHSGKGLLQDYATYLNKESRIDSSILSKIQLQNRIKLFERVAKHLTDPALSKVLEEIKTLQKSFNTQYK